MFLDYSPLKKSLNFKFLLRTTCSVWLSPLFFLTALVLMIYIQTVTHQEFGSKNFRISNGISTGQECRQRSQHSQQQLSQTASFPSVWRCSLARLRVGGEWRARSAARKEGMVDIFLVLAKSGFSSVASLFYFKCCKF